MKGIANRKPRVTRNERRGKFKLELNLENIGPSGVPHPSGNRKERRARS